MAEDADLRVEVRVRGIVAAFVGCVRAMTEAEIRLEGRDRRVLLVVPVLDEWVFEFLGMRDTPNLRGRLTNGLTFFYRQQRRPDDLDFISIAEYVE